jgi:general secretion pathway protein B
MSYILEALRRAEAQRQRGAVPGLHAQPASAALADPVLARQAGARRSWRLVWILAAVLLLAAGARWWLGPSGPSGPSGLEPTIGPAQPFAVAPVARIAAPALEPALAAPLAVPVAPALASSAAAVNTAALPPRVASSAALPLLAAPLPATALASAPRLPTLAELPETVRRELPVFTLGGSVYAEQASQRMVIINGQVMREGDRLAPELLLQQIRLKSVLLDYRGQRFELLF